MPLRVSPAVRPFPLAATLVAVLVAIPGHARAQTDAAFPATTATMSVPADAGTPAGLLATGTPATGTPAAGTTATGLSSAAGAPVPAPIAAPAGLLPATGANLRAGDLQDVLGTGGQPLQPPRRSWTISPSLGLGEEFTATVQGNEGRGRGADFITLFQPGLNLGVDTTRLQGSLSYHPEVDLYARNSGDTQVDQDFGGQLLATVLPGTLFLDLRGDGAVTSNGFGGPAGTFANGYGGATQSVDLSASPYALHRFGPWGTGEIGANVSRTTLGTPEGSPSSVAVPGLSPFEQSTNQNLTSYSGHVAFATGEAFNRYSGTVLGYATKYDGTGVLENAVRDTATIDDDYGLTRLVTVLTRVGYEHIRYNGSNPQRIDDEIWNAGLRLTLGPDSTVSASYGHHDGLDAATVDLALAPTARTRVFLRYSEGLTTEAEQLQSALANSDFDQLGNPSDHSSGAPLLNDAGFFGAQDNLYRSHSLSVTAALTEPRDTVSVNLDAEDNTLVSSSGLPGSLGSNKGLYGGLTWSHALSPLLSLQALGQYGVTEDETGPSGRQDFLLGSLALVDTLSPTLSAQLSYSFDRRSGDGVQASALSQNVVILSAVKSF